MLFILYFSVHRPNAPPPPQKKKKKTNKQKTDLLAIPLVHGGAKRKKGF